MTLSSLQNQDYKKLKGELEVFVEDRVRFHLDANLNVQPGKSNAVENKITGKEVKLILDELGDHRDRIIRLEEGQKLLHSDILSLENSMAVRFDAVQKQFDGMNQRFEESDKSINLRFDAVQKQFDGMNQRFEESEKSINLRFDAVQKQFDGIQHQFDGIQHQFDGIQHQFARVNVEFKRLEDKIEKRFVLLTGVCMLGFTILGLLISFAK